MLAYKNLRFTAGLAAFCLIWLILIPGDPKNAILFGYSRSRLLLIALFIGIITVLGAIILALKRNSSLEQRIAARLQELADKANQREAILFAAGGILLAGIYLLADLLMTTDAQIKGVMLRLAPVIAFIAVSSAQILALQPFKPARRRWMAIILCTILLAALGRLLQPLLLGLLERDYPHDPGLFTASQVSNTFLSYILAWAVGRLPARQRLSWILFGGLTFALFMLQWGTYPKNYWRFQHLLALFAPTIIYLLVVLTLLLITLGEKKNGIQARAVRKGLQIGVLAGLILLAFFYLQATTRHSHVLNFSPKFTDQQAYVDFAKNARLLNFHYTGDHNRTPGYPFLQGLFYRPGISDTAFFEQGKQINILLSLLLLGVMFAISRKLLPEPEALLLLLIIAFSLYIFKAPYFQAEILFYFLFFISYLGMLLMLIRPSWELAIATGLVVGAAHWVKASVLPGLLLFCALYSLRVVLAAYRQVRSQEPAKTWLRASTRQLVYAAAVVFFYLAILSPYLFAMKARFGHYFYNVNTTFYVWYDDNFAAIRAEQQNHFAERWPAHLPDDEVPGLRWYLRNHTLQQVLDRVKFGLSEQSRNILQQFSVTNYHLSYSVIALFILIANLRGSLTLIKKYPYPVLFAALFFLVYMAAFVWYSPISPERRFTYALYIPWMFSLFVSIQGLAHNRNGTQDAYNFFDLRLLSRSAHVLIALSLIINIWLVLSERIYFDRFGS